MRLIGAHHTVAFWGASCAIAFVLSFGLGVVWLGHRQATPSAAALA